MTRYHAHRPPSLASRIAWGVLYGFAAVGVVVGAWALYVLVWATR